MRGILASYFIGRQEELKRLARLRSLNRATITVIKGRRRVGKSTLAKEFAKGGSFISLPGNPPSNGITPQIQRDEFADQLCSQLHLPKVTFSTWADAFRFLGVQIEKKEITVLFDEVSWMGSADPSFLGSLKTWWDQHGSQMKQLVLILCSSISIWIEENVLSSTGFLGRISLVIHVKPLTLAESVDLLRKKGFKGSSYEIFKILSITGGVPWYLDLINPKESADDNIYELCFQPTSQLINEFQTIFHDLFDGRGGVYIKVLQLLVEGMKTLKEIRETLGYKQGGTTNIYLKDLVLAGFVTEHYQWSFKTGKIGKTKLYRLSDCYIRFHLKYITPNREKIQQGLYTKITSGNFPGWDSIIGFQLESLLLSNREFLLRSIGIDPQIVVSDNPYTQRPTTRKKGCQIDYLVQTKLNTFIICEFKFRKNELRTEIINEMERKCSALSIPRGFGKAPVLFHIGGITPKVQESDFFYRIIDLREITEI